MEIKITTDGEVSNTRLFFNGHEINFTEFDIMASFKKTGKGVKMQLIRPAADHPGEDVCSYYRGDFRKMDESMEKK